MGFTVDARLFFDPSSKRELEVALRVLDVYMDVDMKQTSVPVVVRVHPSDARCRAAARGGGARGTRCGNHSRSGAYLATGRVRV